MLDMGIKRRARTPLAELENKEDNGKRVKVEGEIKEFGKLLAQHLGSAEAADTMSAISWNCRGLGNPLTVNALQKVVLEKDPTLVFLMETKFNVTEMDGIKHKIERQQGLVVSSIRRAGGLALLWKKPLQVDILSYSPGHIDAIVNEEQGLKQWRFTGFYGHPETRKRGESWALLESLSRRSNLPWVCMGDFNEIMYAKEKIGGGIRPEGQMRYFREVINKC